MADSEEQLNSLLMKVKEKSEKVGLRLNIQKFRLSIMASGPITSWQIDGVRYSCLENPMDQGAWWVTVLMAANCQTQLSN